MVHEVVLQDNPNLLQEFIRRGCHVWNQSTYDGGTPLHRAAEINSVECARILVEQNADLDSVDFEGRTAFHTAAVQNNFEVA